MSDESSHGVCRPSLCLFFFFLFLTRGGCTFGRALAPPPEGDGIGVVVIEAPPPLPVPIDPTPACIEGHQGVDNWKDWVRTNFIPPLAIVTPQLVSGRSLQQLETYSVLNAFITTGYAKLCWEQLFRDGALDYLETGDSRFYWWCSSTYASWIVGGIFREVIREVRQEMDVQATQGIQLNPFLLFVDLTANANLANAVAAASALGSANYSIFREIAWQHFAAAKCGTPYVINLIAVPGAVTRPDQYRNVWALMDADPKPNVMQQLLAVDFPIPGGTNAIPGGANALLITEQALAEPMLNPNPTVTATFASISQGNIGPIVVNPDGLVTAPFPDILKFKTYSQSGLNVSSPEVNFALQIQRFLWEQRWVVPGIIRNLTGANGVAGIQVFKTFIALILDRRKSTVLNYPGVFPAFAPRTRLADHAAWNGPPE